MNYTPSSDDRRLKLELRNGSLEVKDAAIRARLRSDIAFKYCVEHQSSSGKNSPGLCDRKNSSGNLYVCPINLRRPFHDRRPQRDDLLELERQLSKLGLESKTGGPGGRARYRAGTGTPGAHLSSALGESFCLLNQSVIFGGGLAAGAGGLGGPIGAGAMVPSQVPPPKVSSTGAEAVALTGPLGARPSMTHRGDGRTDGAIGATTVDSGRDSRIRQDNAVDGDGRNSIVAEEKASRRRSRDGQPVSASLVKSGESTRVGGAGHGEALVGESRDGRSDGLERRAANVASVDGAGHDPAQAEARRAQEETQQAEIMRLLTCLKTLGDENVSLMKECEDRDKVVRLGGHKGYRFCDVIKFDEVRENRCQVKILKCFCVGIVASGCYT